MPTVPEPNLPDHFRSNRNLIVIGASTRATIELAAQEGFQCRSYDLFADWDTQQMAICKRLTCLSEAAELDATELSDIKGSTPLVFTGGLENLLDHEEIASLLPAPLRKSSIRSQNPNELADLASTKPFKEIDVAFPPIYNQPPNPIASGTRFLIKPLTGAGGSEVRPFESGVSIDADQEYLQERKEGRLIGANFIADRSVCHLLGISDQSCGLTEFGAGEFQYCLSIADHSAPAELESRLTKLGSALAIHFGLLGCFGADLLIDNNRLWILDINPRFTASLEVTQANLDNYPLVSQHLRAVNQRDFNACPTSVATPLPIGKAVIFNRSNSDVEVTQQIFEAIGTWHHTQVSPKGTVGLVSDIPVAGTIIRPSSPIVTVRTPTVTANPNTAQLAKEKSESFAILQTLASDLYSLWGI